MNSRINAQINEYTRHHHGTLRLLYVMVGLVLVGAALYLVLAYGIFSSVPTVPKVSMATSPSLPVATSTSASPTAPTKNSPILVLTPADSNKTITLEKDEDFRINLGNTLRWTLFFSPSSAVTKLLGIANDKYQGTYQTLSTGTITLKASGAPICTPEAACPDFIRVITITLTVQ